MGFQTTVSQQLAPGIAGDFASANPRSSVLSVPGGLVAGALGLSVGLFAWVDAAALIANNFGAGAPDGFVHREQQGVISSWFQESGILIPAGLPVTVHSRGDFWAKTLNAATKGQKVFANLGTGEVRTAAAAATIAGFIGTASFATNVMTVASAPTGVLHVGDVITAAGVAAGTYITALGTGTGGVGTYALSTTPGVISTEAVTASSYVETRWFCDTPADVNELIKISTWN